MGVAVPVAAGPGSHGEELGSMAEQDVQDLPTTARGQSQALPKISLAAPSHLPQPFLLMGCSTPSSSWILSSVSMSLSYGGAQNWTHHFSLLNFKRGFRARR